MFGRYVGGVANGFTAGKVGGGSFVVPCCVIYRCVVVALGAVVVGASA